MPVRITGECGCGKRLMSGCYVPLEWTSYASHPSVVRAVFSYPSGMGLWLLWDRCSLHGDRENSPCAGCVCEKNLITHPSKTRQWGLSH